MMARLLSQRPYNNMRAHQTIYGVVPTVTTFLRAGLVCIASVGAASAATAGQPPPLELAHGGAAPAHLAIFGSANPAAPSLNPNRLRVGVLSNLSGGYEIGDADDFDREVNRVTDDFNDLEFRINRLRFSETMPEPAEIRSLVEDVIDFENDANALVSDLTDAAYGKFTGSVTGPGAPLSLRSNVLEGVVTLDYAAYVEARVALESSGDAFNTGLRDLDPSQIDEPTQVEVVGQPNGIPVLIIDGEEYGFRASEDAGLAVQGGIVRRLSGGYSQAVGRSDEGALHAGVTAHIYRVTLARSGILLDDSADTLNVAEDEFDDNQTTTGGVGLDAGLVWVTDSYSIGGTLKNINAPSFDYPDPCASGNTESCAFFKANPQARRNGNSWSMERQVTLEGSAFTADRRWIASARLDLNSVADATGDDTQWAAISGAYVPVHFWIPSPRVGYRRNLTGEGLSFINAGLTFFRALRLDGSMALESSSLNGTNLPRSAQANLGLDLQF